MNTTLAHKDTLKYLKGYPIIIEPGSILFSFDSGTLGIDAHGNRLYAEEDITSIEFGAGPFLQGATRIEREAKNLTVDSRAENISNWDFSPSGRIEGDEYKPYHSHGSNENSLCVDIATAQQITIRSNNFTTDLNTNDNIIQSCWIKTDATAVRFIYDSLGSGTHIDDWITIQNQTWQHIEAANYYTATSDDASQGMRSFYIQTSANATFLYIFHPQMEIGTYSTSWTENIREKGKLVYSNSYFSTEQFSLAVWFKVEHFNGSYNTVVSAGHDNGDFEKFIIYRENNSSKLHIKGSNKNIILFDSVTPIDINIGKWYHTSITFDGSIYKFFINGEKYDELKEPRKISFHPLSKLFVGTHYYDNLLEGFVSDLLISTHPIEDLMIRYLYEGGQPIYNPMAYVGQV